VVALAQRIINEAQLARPDYVEVADAEALKPIEIAGPNSVLLLAVFFGKTRLIDNMRLGLGDAAL
jgi:pantoate--beta-alanine ligase